MVELGCLFGLLQKLPSQAPKRAGGPQSGQGGTSGGMGGGLVVYSDAVARVKLPSTAFEASARGRPEPPK